MKINADRIKRRRTELGMTMDDLADKMDMTRPGLHNMIKQGDKITLEKVKKLARALDLEPRELLI